MAVGDVDLHPPDGLFFLILAPSVIGTVVPQQQPQNQYLIRFGEVWGKRSVGRFYQRLFQPLVSRAHQPAGAHILACVVHGLPQAVKRTLQPLTVETALTLPERGLITWPPKADPPPRIAAHSSRELGH